MKMTLNVCPCMPLGNSVKILSLFDAILAGICFGLFTTFLVLYAREHIPDSVVVYKVFLIVTLSLGVVFSIVDFLLAGILFIAAIKRSTKVCYIWMIITGLIVGLTIVYFISDLVKARVGIYNVGLILWIPFKIFEILVVHAFIREVRDVGEIENGKVFSMTDKQRSNPQPSYTPAPQ